MNPTCAYCGVELCSPIICLNGDPICPGCAADLYVDDDEGVEELSIDEALL